MLVHTLTDMPQALPGLVILETIPAEEGNTYPYRIHTIYSGMSQRRLFVSVDRSNIVNRVQLGRVARQLGRVRS